MCLVLFCMARSSPSVKRGTNASKDTSKCCHFSLEDFLWKAIMDHWWVHLIKPSYSSHCGPVFVKSHFNCFSKNIYLNISGSYFIVLALNIHKILQKTLSFPVFNCCVISSFVTCLYTINLWLVITQLPLFSFLNICVLVWYASPYHSSLESCCIN